MANPKHANSPALEEFLATHSYDGEPMDPARYMTPELDADPDDEEIIGEDGKPVPPPIVW